MSAYRQYVAGASAPPLSESVLGASERPSVASSTRGGNRNRPQRLTQQPLYQRAGTPIGQDTAALPHSSPWPLNSSWQPRSQQMTPSDISSFVQQQPQYRNSPHQGSSTSHGRGGGASEQPQPSSGRGGSGASSHRDPVASAPPSEMGGSSALSRQQQQANGSSNSQRSLFDTAAYQNR
jgi:hypothetical protein